MRRMIFGVMAVLFTVLAGGWGVPGTAMAQCGGLPGAIDAGTECTVDAAVVANGVFNIPKTLHILDQGKLTTTAAGGLTLNITGNLVIDVPLGGTGTNGISGNVSGAGAGTANPVTVDATGDIILRGDGTKGAAITSDRNGGSCGTAEGGQIALTSSGVAGDFGDITVEKGAVVTANGFPCPAGDIVIATQANGLVTIAGLVESRSTQSGTGRPGGGTITIKAGCNLLVTGKVSSRGFNPGADLVHLEGCVVQIQGLVESTGSGHHVPTNPPNHCNGAFRPGKPANSTACVEIVGTTVEIGPNGEVNADTAITAGGNGGRGWIDVFGREVSIVGPATGNYAVHANQPAGTNGRGGLIRIVAVNDGATSGDITTSGRAVQANALPNGGQGGEVTFEALNDILFGTASIQARGANAGGGDQAGGTITATAYNGAITGAAPGELNADGGGGQAVLDPGLVTLNACTLVNYTGTVIPAPPVINVGGVCGGAPVLPVYIVLPAADCLLLCGGTPDVSKTGVKFNDLNQNGVKDAGEPGLNGWEIHLFGTTATGVPVHLVTTTSTINAIVGTYEFNNLQPGSYTVCEVLQTDWTQTAPCTAGDPATCVGTPIPPGEAIANCTGHTDGGTITPGPRGYSFTITGTPGELFANNDFGNFQEPGECPKFPDLTPDVTLTIDPGKATQIQDAINLLPVGQTLLILPHLGKKTENITIDKRVNVVGCSITLTATDSSLPVVDITSGANGGLTKDVHATGSTVAGYKIGSNNHTIQNTRAFGNAIGFWITGNSNHVNGALGTTDNGIGFKIDGNSNTLDTNNGVENNLGDGVLITGDNNTVKKYTVRSNGGNGIKVEATASGTILSEDKAYTNALNGYHVLGINTKLSKNLAADNTGCEFLVVAGNTNGKDNKANNVTILPNVLGPFPTGCIE